MSKRKTTEQFIKEAKEKHGEEYDYSLVDYKTNKIHVNIKCKNCGTVFPQLPYKHLQGNGCKICGMKESLKKQLANPKKKHVYKKTLEQFIQEAKEKHGEEYDYSLVEYKNTDTKVNIICNKCGNVFPQTPDKHISRGQGCPYCANNRPFTKEDFVKRAIDFHGDKYDYSKTVYVRALDKVEIFCKKCGRYFWQEARAHMYKSGCCYCRESAGEERIRNYLESKGVQLIGQMKYDDLKDKDLLSYDFYLPDYNLLIEFNGEQHYNKNAFNKTYKEFLTQKHHDWLKRKYCVDNKIDLLIIPYWEFNNIENILEGGLKWHLG